MTATGKILVSGLKPTGRPHIGNYLGAMKQFVDLQENYDARIFIADYHALTSLQDPETLRQMTYDIAVDYLAIGLDPARTRIFVQSAVPAHTELAVILSNVVPGSYLTRAHAYKDAEQKGEEVNAGTLYYPILMAADILMYDAQVVPVGSDQKQHIEYARDFAERFNRIFGPTFRVPEALIIEATETVPGLDGRKMSKSYGNTIPLFAEDEEIEKAVRSIPTDSQGVDQPKKGYEQDMVYQLHTFFTPPAEFARIKEGYEQGGLSYQESKAILIKSLQNYIRPLRENRQVIAQDRDFVQSVLAEGGRAARRDAMDKMEVVRQAAGLGGQTGEELTG